MSKTWEKNPSDILKDKDDSIKKGNDLGSEYNIVGAPYRYNMKADKADRVFDKSLGRHTPVVSIMPGSPNIFGGNKGILDNAMEVFKNPTTSGLEGLFAGMKSSFSKEEDMRYYTFKPEIQEYKDYVYQILGRLIAKMDVNNMSRSLTNYYNISNFTGIPFAYDKSSTITEDLSNQFGDSKLKQAADKASDMGKLANMLKQGDQEVQKNQDNSAGGATSVDELLDPDNLKTVASGSNLLFPKIWQDSNFSKNYSLKFNFRSPYGSTRAILENVYVPICMLLALTLPKQTSLMGYKSPFLIRARAPGHFNISIGAISSLTIKKGGKDNLWNENGLPLAAEVTVNIEDLYSTLRMNQFDKAFQVNKGLTMYLDTLAGSSTADMSFLDTAEQKINSMFWRMTRPLEKFQQDINFLNETGSILEEDLKQIKNAGMNSLRSMFYGKEDN